ncbi:MAG: DUF2461 domain-containing protein [Rikenellaceae bacterium]|nr:DUF2461 domain-containing protein [Rikenellaceae bacterium]
MKELMDFLLELGMNNNKEWFDKNKSRYQDVQGWFNELTGRILDGVSSFDPLVRGLTVKDCNYRIYRDMRFSKDKTPYKTHIGAYICPNGKKSGYAGYYFHIEPLNGSYKTGSFISSGIYMPEPVVLKSLREEILDNGDGLISAVESAQDFTLNMDNKLKKSPTGFPKDSPYDELLKQKDFFLEKPLDDRYLLDRNLAERIIEDFSKTYKLTEILNRAVQYAYEEMV